VKKKENCFLKVKQHDDEAFQRLVTSNLKLVVYFAIRRGSKEYLEDLIQEGMIGLHKAIVNFSSEKGKFEPFAILVIKQQILDAVKKSTRIKTGNKLQKISIERDYFREVENANLLEIIERKEEFNERFKNIEKLLSKKEFVIFEHYLSGMSIKEIANEESLTTKSVENALFRIKSKLKKGAN